MFIIQTWNLIAQLQAVWAGTFASNLRNCWFFLFFKSYNNSCKRKCAGVLTGLTVIISSGRVAAVKLGCVDSKQQLLECRQKSFQRGKKKEEIQTGRDNNSVRRECVFVAPPYLRIQKALNTNYTRRQSEAAASAARLLFNKLIFPKDWDWWRTAAVHTSMTRTY